LALITGIEAVEIAFKSYIISHFFIFSANKSKHSIIFSLSGRYRFVTAMSMSLDSNANPVTKDPNYFIFGVNFLLFMLFKGDG
jgi:hypothetical protein